MQAISDATATIGNGVVTNSYQSLGNHDDSQDGFSIARGQQRSDMQPSESDVPTRPDGQPFSLPPGMHSFPVGYDGKRVRKSVFRKTIDYNHPMAKYLDERLFYSTWNSRTFIQPDYLFQGEILPPAAMMDAPMNCVSTKHIRTSTNKNRCPIFSVCWTPEGRRLITGAASGEFTLWNGLTFNFETILQAHESAIRCMLWSHNEEWLLTADSAGFVKYWQANMNNVKMYQAHKDPVRGCSFCPTDSKFVTCSDDATVRIWDFIRCKEERVLRGHGADVRCVAWHPHKSLVISGSKDAQQPIKLWDPKSGESLSTLYVHKNTCTDVQWNQNGNWFLTASRDHLIKLFDIRNLREEIQTFRGHKKDVLRVSWHPIYESLFASGGAEGALLYWNFGAEVEVGGIEDAHENMIWSLAWHPLGHIMVTGSNDFSTKFWSRNRPGDVLREASIRSSVPQEGSTAPGLFTPKAPAPHHQHYYQGRGSYHHHRAGHHHHQQPQQPFQSLSAVSAGPNLRNKSLSETDDSSIPALGDGTANLIPGFRRPEEDEEELIPKQPKKKPASKSIPKSFQAAWVKSRPAGLPALAHADSDAAGLSRSMPADFEERIPQALPPQESEMGGPFAGGPNNMQPGFMNPGLENDMQMHMHAPHMHREPFPGHHPPDSGDFFGYPNPNAFDHEYHGGPPFPPRGLPIGRSMRRPDRGGPMNMRGPRSLLGRGHPARPLGPNQMGPPPLGQKRNWEAANTGSMMPRGGMPSFHRPRGTMRPRGPPRGGVSSRGRGPW